MEEWCHRYSRERTQTQSPSQLLIRSRCDEHVLVLLQIDIEKYKNNRIKLKDEVGMAMPKSIQTRFFGTTDNHNHYISLCLLFYRPIDVDLFKSFLLLFMIPMLLKKASVGMYGMYV